MNRAVAAGDDQCFIAEALDSHCRFGGRAERFRGLKIDLVVDLAT